MREKVGHCVAQLQAAQIVELPLAAKERQGDKFFSKSPQPVRQPNCLPHNINFSDMLGGVAR